MTAPSADQQVQHERATSIEPLMSVDDLAAFLRRSTKTIYRYVKQRRIPHLRGPGGQLHFERRAVLGAMRLNAGSAVPPTAVSQPATTTVLASMASDLTNLTNLTNLSA